MQSQMFSQRNQQGQKNITLKGSAQMVAEFFNYALNSILFQRGLYPSDDFKMVKKYGMNLLVLYDEQILDYMKALLSQIEKWLGEKRLSRLVLAIISKETGNVLERWQFDIQLDQDYLSKDKENSMDTDLKTKPEAEIHSEIGAILRQITASVSFLPIFDERCTFNVLAYTEGQDENLLEWEESDAKMITENAEQVRIRGFSTSVHRVDALVSYRVLQD